MVKHSEFESESPGDFQNHQEDSLGKRRLIQVLFLIGAAMIGVVAMIFVIVFRGGAGR